MKIKLKELLLKQSKEYENAGIFDDVHDMLLLGIIASLVAENMSNESIREELLTKIEECAETIGKKEVLWT